MKGHPRVFLAVAALGAFMTFGLAEASAGTVSVIDNFDGTKTLDFTAEPGEHNSVTIIENPNGPGLAVFDSVMIASTDCQPGTNERNVICTDPDLRFATADLGDEDDGYDLSAPLDAPGGIRGGEGGDTLLGGPGPDLIDGEDGDDHVDGRLGPDVLFGGEDDETADSVFGGGGSDRFRLGSLDGADLLEGGPGVDRLTTFTPFLQVGFRYTLGDRLPNDGLAAQGVNLLNIEDLDSGEAVDFVRGSAEPNVVNTLDGDDNVDLLGGPDKLDTGSQNDTVEARDGFSDRISCGTGTDTVRADQLDELSGCENVTRSFVAPFGTPPGPSRPRPAATLTLAGCAAGKTAISLGAGNDTRNGTAGGDLILALAGNDVIDGLSGDDCIDLGAGNDRGQGGSGRDLVIGGLGVDVLTGSSGDDRVSGGAGGDRLLGNTGNDSMSGGPAGDRLSGGFGNDRLSGDSGNDRISGSRGRDRMAGGAGNDRMDGGSSADRLQGNSGNDRISAHDDRRDRINCGPGSDRVVADDVDIVASNCESVTRRR